MLQPPRTAYSVILLCVPRAGHLVRLDNLPSWQMAGLKPLFSLSRWLSCIPHSLCCRFAPLCFVTPSCLEPRCQMSENGHVQFDDKTLQRERTKESSMSSRKKSIAEKEADIESVWSDEPYGLEERDYKKKQVRDCHGLVAL